MSTKRFLLIALCSHKRFKLSIKRRITLLLVDTCLTIKYYITLHKLIGVSIILGKRQPTPLKLGAEDIGATEYLRDEAELLDVDQNEDVMAIVALAVNVHHRKARRRRHASNYHEDNEYPKDRPPRLALPKRMDPRRPVLQLARAGIQDFGFRSVVSLDSTRPLTSNRGVDQAGQWIGGVNGWVEKVNRHSGDQGADPGLVIFVERSEDDENPRLHQLRESIGNLAVPYLTLITTADPNCPPLYDDIDLEEVDIAPELRPGEFDWLESV